MLSWITLPHEKDVGDIVFHSHYIPASLTHTAATTATYTAATTKPFQWPVVPVATAEENAEYPKPGHMHPEEPAHSLNR